MLPWARDEEEQVEERHVVEVAGEEAADGHLEEVAPDPVADAGALERTQPTVRASHSAARFAVHGASSGTCLAMRSILALGERDA